MLGWAYNYIELNLSRQSTKKSRQSQILCQRKILHFLLSYIQIRDKQIKFFPLLQALCLEAEEDETAQQLKELRTMVTSVLERFKEEVRALWETEFYATYVDVC